ncbi:MAG: hypothetical protein ACLP7P_00130 [Rhodomicrobium sp.]
MRILSGLRAVVFCVLLFGCSWPPTLEQTTGSSEPPKVFIKDVLQRVKCEIFDAAQSLQRRKNLEWMKDWSAKNNLSLSLVTSAGLTPNVSAVNPLQNAYYVAVSPREAAYLAGKPVSALTPSSTMTAVAQKFTLGASLTLSENATRTETIVFTEAFGDVVLNPSSKAPADCDKLGSELRGNLGLREWIESAVEQVSAGQLLSFRRTADNPLWSSSFEDLRGVVCALSDNYDQTDQTKPRNRDFDAYCNGNYPALDKVANVYWDSAKDFNDICVDEAALHLIDLITPKSKDYLPRNQSGDVESVKSEISEIKDHQNRRTTAISTDECRLAPTDLASKIDPSSQNTSISGASGGAKSTSGSAGGGAKKASPSSKLDAELSLQAYKTSIIKSIDEALKQYKENIKSYVDVLQNKNDKQNINETIKELTKLRKLLTSDGWDVQQYTDLAKLNALTKDLTKLQAEKNKNPNNNGTDSNKPKTKNRANTPSGESAGQQVPVVPETNELRMPPAPSAGDEIADTSKFQMPWRFPVPVEAQATTAECKSLSEMKDHKKCNDGPYIGAITLHAYLKLYDRMQTYVDQLNTFIKSGVKPAKPIDSLTHTVTFVVTYGGSISPNWTLINVVTANSPLATAQGLRTHTLLMTIGPDSENVANLATQQVVNILTPH